MAPRLHSRAERNKTPRSDPPFIRSPPRITVDLTPTALLLEPNADVNLPSLIPRLALQLLITAIPRILQRSPLERVPHRAARLRTVAAVAEPAPGRDVLDVLERAANALLVFEEENRAHSRCVDQHPSLREKVETSSRRRMATTVVRADSLNPRDVLAEKRVHDRGFPDA